MKKTELTAEQIQTLNAYGICTQEDNDNLMFGYSDNAHSFAFSKRNSENINICNACNNFISDYYVSFKEVEDKDRADYIISIEETFMQAVIAAILPKQKQDEESSNPLDILLIRMEEFLLRMADTNHESLSSNQISWINNDVDYVAVKYFRNTPDGDKQEEFAKEEPEYIDIHQALSIYMTRINNSF